MQLKKTRKDAPKNKECPKTQKKVDNKTWKKATRKQYKYIKP